MGEMRVMGKSGDTRLMWDPAIKEEVDAAKRMFDDLRKKGFLAFHVAKKGDKGEQITTFDPKATKLIMAAQMQGG